MKANMIVPSVDKIEQIVIYIYVSFLKCCVSTFKNKCQYTCIYHIITLKVTSKQVYMKLI